MAGHNRQGLRAAREIGQESIKAFSVVIFTFPVYNALTTYYHTNELYLTILSNIFYYFKALFIGLIFKVGYMDPAEEEVKKFYEKQAASK